MGNLAAGLVELADQQAEFLFIQAVVLVPVKTGQNLLFIQVGLAQRLPQLAFHLVPAQFLILIFVDLAKVLRDRGAAGLSGRVGLLLGGRLGEGGSAHQQ